MNTKESINITISPDGRWYTAKIFVKFLGRNVNQCFIMSGLVYIISAGFNIHNHFSCNIYNRLSAIKNKLIFLKLQRSILYLSILILNLLYYINFKILFLLCKIKKFERKFWSWSNWNRCFSCKSVKNRSRTDRKGTVKRWKNIGDK